MIALAIHETGMIYLAPVVCAIMWEKQAWRDIDWRSVGAAAAVTAAGLGFYVICSKAKVDVHAAAMHVHTQFAHFEALNWADLASYFNLISFRTIETTWCEIPKNPKYGMQVLAGVFLLTLLSVTLRPKRWRVTLICVLVPFLFISAVATDVGRWAVLGVASILILALTQPQEEDRFNWMFTALALLAFPLMTKGLGSGGGEASPIPRINYLQRYPSLYTPPADILLDICDPGWRDLLGLPKDETARPSGMAPFIKDR